jgi:hypothetical protein
MSRFLLILSMFLYTTTLNSQSKIQKDRDAINKMCGCFEIQFNFKETFQRIDDEEYVPSKEYRSFALELAIPIVNENKKISIQHLLIVGPPNNQSVIKHWRQDWVYQNQDLYTYETANTWNYTKMSKKVVKGQWTQKVFKLMTVQDMKGPQLGFMLMEKAIGKILTMRLFLEENIQKEMTITLC